MKKSKRNSRNYGWCKAWSILTADQVAGVQQMISAAVPVKAEEVIDIKKVLSQRGR